MLNVKLIQIAVRMVTQISSGVTKNLANACRKSHKEQASMTNSLILPVTATVVHHTLRQECAVAGEF